MAPTARRKRPGRPPAKVSPQVRGALLDAARELCIEHGFERATIKRIAARAGVNPAMISYYFTDKEGLGNAMMRAAVAPLVGQLELAAAAAETATLDDFMRGYMRAVAANPWLPQLVVREVLPVNGRFREVFVTELVTTAAELLGKILLNERRAGRLRSDHDPRLVLVTLMSLCLFPFVAAPVIAAALRVDVEDERFLDSLIEHNIGVFGRAFRPECQP